MSELAAGQLITPAIRLDHVLGRGGMGSLWMAYHLRLRVRVVVKFIASEFAGNREVMARFEREAAATMAAKSAHVVQILDYGFTEEKVPFIAMEHLEGEDLATKIDREARIAPWEFAEILRQACKGLTRAHAEGIIHRDIKPENIFLTYVDGELAVKVLDFGIAKADNTAFGFGATRTGVFLGTVYYMSPEQTMGAKNVDHRTDLWSLGVMAYYALTGVRPFEADAIGALVTHITATPITPPSRHLPALGPALDHWMAQALARDPGTRFASARELATAFDAAVGQIVGWAPAASEGRPSEVLNIPAGRARHGDRHGESDGAIAVRATGVELYGSEPALRASPNVGARAFAGGNDAGAVGQYSSNVSGRPPSAPAPTETPAAMSASIGASAVGSLDDSVDMPPKSYRPLLIGIGIGIGVCLVFIFGLGLASVRGRQPGPAPSVASSPEPPSAPATPAARLPAPTPEPNPIFRAITSATAPDLPPPPSSVARTSPVGTSAGSRKPAARPSAAPNDNPFDGTY